MKSRAEKEWGLREKTCSQLRESLPREASIVHAYTVIRVHACAFKPFRMQQRSSSSCQTWKQLVCQGDYLQESALGRNHLYRFRDVKPHLFVWNRLQRKSRPDCGSTDQEGKETTTCRNFSEEISAELWTMVSHYLNSRLLDIKETSEGEDWLQRKKNSERI